MKSLKPFVMSLSLIAGSCLIATGTAALAQSASTDMASPAAMGGKVSGADRDFMTKAATGGLAEVSLSQLAQQKASSPDIKQFASHMIDDHTKANDELKGIASSKGVTLPAEPTPMQKQDMAKLEGLSGAAFDNAYIKQMLADHKKTIALFEKGAKAPDNDVKSFASKTLPTLKDHLQMAQKVAQEAGKSKAAAVRATGASRG